MVMYNSDGSTLVLDYGNNVPGAAEVIRDIKDAPIEDEKKLVTYAKLGKKAEAEVIEVAGKLGFKKIEKAEPLSFEIPVNEISEQALLMN